MFDDHWSVNVLPALVFQGRREEAGIIARQRAESGNVGQYFYYLNLVGEHEALIAYLEDNWADLDAFEVDVPPGLFGYFAMVNVAHAYQRVGRMQPFANALSRLHAANLSARNQGVDSRSLMVTSAAHAAMKGDHDLALEQLGKAVDLGFVTSARISQGAPWFASLEGDPEYEAIQARMIDNVNRERALLGLGPIET